MALNHSSNQTCRYSHMATGSSSCGSPLSRKGVLARGAGGADEETFLCVDRPSRHNDASWMDSSSAIKASPTVVHSVFVNAGSLSMRPFFASDKSPLFFLRRPTLTQVYASILEFTMLSAAQHWFGGGQWNYAQDSDMKPTAQERQDWLHIPCVRVHHACAEDATLSRPHPRREPLGIGGEASLASPAKNARGVETCSGCGVDGGDDGGVLYHSG